MMQAVLRSAVMRSEPGHSIDDHVVAAIELAKIFRCSVQFVFNDIPIEVRQSTDPNRIYVGWDEIKRRQAELVGARVAHDGSVKWGRTD